MVSRSPGQGPREHASSTRVGVACIGPASGKGAGWEHPVGRAGAWSAQERPALGHPNQTRTLRTSGDGPSATVDSRPRIRPPAQSCGHLRHVIPTWDRPVRPGADGEQHPGCTPRRPQHPLEVVTHSKASVHSHCHGHGPGGQGLPVDAQ